MINIYIFRSRLSWVNSSFHPQNQFENFLKEVNEVFTDYHGRAFREHFLGCQVWLSTDQWPAGVATGGWPRCWAWWPPGRWGRGTLSWSCSPLQCCSGSGGTATDANKQELFQILGTVNKSIKIKFIGYPVLYVQYTIYFFNPLPAELLGCQWWPLLHAWELCWPCARPRQQ